MRRNPLVVFVLSIVTFGAYWVYWYWQTNEELRQRGELVRPAVSALAASWGVFLIVPVLVSLWTTADRVRNRAEAAGGEGPNPAIALLLALVLCYPPYLQWHLNRLAPDPRAA